MSHEPSNPFAEAREALVAKWAEKLDAGIRHNERLYARIAELEAREADLVEVLRRATSKIAVRAALQEHDLAALAAADSILSEWKNETPRGLGSDAVEMVREVLDLFDSGVWDRLYAGKALSKEYAQGIARRINEALALLPPRRP